MSLRLVHHSREFRPPCGVALTANLNSGPKMYLAAIRARRV